MVQVETGRIEASRNEEIFQITPRVVLVSFFFLTLLVITYLVFYVPIRDANIIIKASGKIEICFANISC